MRPAVKASGEKYWEYVLCYVDALLVVSEKPKLVMDYMESKYTLKPGSVKEPESYLGADIRKWKIDRAEHPTKDRWAMSLDT